ncbi:MAG: asparagine synthetase B [Methanosaeta sp. PtaU1.Bin112]|nr:MAG: asparagine synthetase B [Methanosaeta sp. PtaU1.Bin112]
MDLSLKVRGWVERDGKRLDENDIREILFRDPAMISRLGGEFFLEWNECKARDHFGIMPGDCPAGAMVCKGDEIRKVDPQYPLMDLDEAIRVAVRLRSDEGIVALSGGVDSALVARLAGRECVAVGLAGSHDLRHAREVAEELGLVLHEQIIDPASIEEALAAVLAVIPKKDPVNASIATTLYFVSQWAGQHGHRRILAGQGADELFGGYSRYLETATLAKDMEKDFQGLAVQLARDQAVAGLHGTYFSLPYMDERVVVAARSIPAEMRVANGVRKRQLRAVAGRYMPAAIAQYEKKAMQYGSGVMKWIEKLAARKGYRRALQDYLREIGKEAGLEAHKEEHSSSCAL